MPQKPGALLLCAALCGCASYQAKPIDPAASAAALARRSLSDEGLKRFAGDAQWPPAEWDVDSLVKAALYFQPDLDVARAQWATAKAGSLTAAQRPNPSLAAGPFGFISNAPAGTPAAIYGVALDLPWETGGKRGARLLRAAAAEGEAHLNLASAAWSARSRLRAAALSLWAAQESETVLRHQLSELETNERLLSERAGRGESSPFNLAQALLLADKSRLALAEARKRAVEARAGLAQALGVPFSAAAQIRLSSAAFPALPTADDASLAQARHEALLGRPAILAGLARYAAAEADLRQEIARQYPDVHLGPGYSYDQGLDKWGIGVNLPIPIMNRNEGPIAEASARRAEAGARFLQLQARVIGELDFALEAYREAFDRVRTADKALARAVEQDGILRSILRPGDVSRLTLFRSSLDVDTTRLARLAAFADAQQALGALEDALERPLLGAPPAPELYERPLPEGR